MKMEFLFFAFLVMSFSVQAKVGGVDGGGGRSIVCRNPDNSIKSAEILDLYEGRIQYTLPYTENDNDWSKQIDDILKNSGLNERNNRLGYEISLFLPRIKSKMILLPDDTQLTDVDDSYEAIAPVGCKTEQAVNYVNDNLILFNGLIWKSLSQTQRAALVLHEAIYKVLRTETPPEKNSLRSRHFNAFLFSGGKAVYPYDYADSEAQIFCDGFDKFGAYSSLVARRKAENNFKITFDFLVLNDRRLLSKTSLTNYNFESPSNNPSEIFEQLLNPTYRSYFSGETISNFEGEDYVSITLTPEDSFGPSRVFLHVKPKFENSSFDVSLKCTDPRQHSAN